MRLVYKLLFVFVLFYSCQDKTKTATKNNEFELIPLETSYTISVNDTKVLSKIAFVQKYLDKTDLNFIEKLAPQKAFTTHIIQNNSKLTGFIVVADLPQTDSIFNGDTYVYDKQNVLSESFQKKHYYASQIQGKTFISNQKLFIENCIRNQEDLLKTAKNPDFIKGVKLLDKNAPANIIVNLSNLKPDVFYLSSLQIHPQEWTNWQFFDVIDTDKPIFSGLSVNNDSTKLFLNIFDDVKPTVTSFENLVPFSVSENISFRFDNFESFQTNLSEFTSTNSSVPTALKGLKALDYFIENNQKAVILFLENPADFTGTENEAFSVFGNNNIYKCETPSLVNQYFNHIIPTIKLTYYSVFEQYVILTENQTYLQKILNDIQNQSTLANNTTYKGIQAELPGSYQLTLYKRSSLQGKSCMQMHTFNNENGEVFTNFVCLPVTQQKNEVLIEQVLSCPLKEEPITKPQLVWNHHSKAFNIIYQNEEKELVLLNLKGKQLWKTPIKNKIVGKIKQIDLLRNHKLQYTFVTPHHWYVVDRLGRNVEKFPEYFLQKITKGISVFDYEHNRKYRFGITQNKKFRLFDNKAKKVAGFKVKTENEIFNAPQHIRIGNKDFIVMQDIDGKLYLLNRRGEIRIKINQSFKTNTNPWGAYNKKFINIDDDNKLIAIDLSGKIKTAKLNWNNALLSNVKYGTLAAVADHKLLINKKTIDLDLGTYTRPQIYKLDKKIYIFVADTDNNKIYAFNSQAKPIDKFPIIGHEILDVRSDKSGKHILTYDDAHNLIVYKF